MRLAQEKHDVKRAQKLRYRVFYKDGTATADRNGNFTITPSSMPDGFGTVAARVANGSGSGSGNAPTNPWTAVNFVQTADPTSAGSTAVAAALAGRPLYRR